MKISFSILGFVLVLVLALRAVPGRANDIAGSALENSVSGSGVESITDLSGTYWSYNGGINRFYIRSFSDTTWDGWGIDNITGHIYEAYNTRSASTVAGAIPAVKYTTSTTNGNTIINVRGTVSRINSQWQSMSYAVVEVPAATANERIWPIVIRGPLDTLKSTAIGDSSLDQHYCGIRYSTNVGDAEWKCCVGNKTSTECVSLGARVTGPRIFEVMPDAGCRCRIRTLDGVLEATTKTTVANIYHDSYYGLAQEMATLTTASVNFTVAVLGIRKWRSD